MSKKVVHDQMDHPVQPEERQSSVTSGSSSSEEQRKGERERLVSDGAGGQDEGPEEGVHERFLMQSCQIVKHKMYQIKLLHFLFFSKVF